MKFLSYITLVLFSAILISCGENEKGVFGDSPKPKARGSVGEIVLAIDSTKWAGPVGDELREIFEADLPGMIRSESMFKVHRVDPRAMTRMLKMYTNLVYVTTFDDKKGGSQVINAQFSKESKEKAAADPSLYSLRMEDEYATGQEVLYLFGNTEEELVANLKKNKERLQNLFEVRERGRLEKPLFARKNSAAEHEARTKLGIEIQAPASYQIAKSTDDFLWLRSPSPTERRPDISVFFFETDYTSEEQTFPANILSLRDSIAATHVFGDPEDPRSFMTSEKQIPPAFRNMVINDNFTVEIRGTWKTNNLSMGGTYLGYVMVDPEKGKLYYMEGFVYFPNEVHRDALREIQTILLNTDVSWKESQGA
ncbi:DUF4837 family protein [Algoriphagus aestuariicola]|jgi:hypothetical protein|uniref:DUF4837 family protein n=1 Tax=Algoriphagus aestuariicola TaxID=1852016 RepID=A0ABS3BM66_9BACT|nr:DUF4837 family protein [Algoriphagus aestuariicola]MBN7799326.1 DUF4837 family protein [Algoriphagus aestuariicola]